MQSKNWYYPPPPRLLKLNYALPNGGSVLTTNSTVLHSCVWLMSTERFPLRKNKILAHALHPSGTKKWLKSLSFDPYY